jgi:tripartite-type tricarboxylate transporter receptor subunit TctC
VQFLIGSSPSVAPHLQAGRLRALAFAAPRRSIDFPDVPTFTESGLPGMEMRLWYALFGPKGLADALVMQMNTNVRAALADANFEAQLARQGLVPVGGTPAQLASTVREDIKLYRTLAARAGVVPE